MWESYASKMESGTIKGNLSMYMKSLLRFSLVTVAISTTSLLSVYTHRSPEFTLFKLSRQNGHDWDLVRLQNIPNHLTFFNWTKNTCQEAQDVCLNFISKDSKGKTGTTNLSLLVRSLNLIWQEANLMTQTSN